MKILTTLAVMMTSLGVIVTAPTVSNLDPLVVKLSGGITSDKIYNLETQMKKAQPGQKIILIINSPGGELLPALRLIDLMKTNKSQEVCQIENLAASGAALIAGACDDISATPAAIVMFHLPYHLGDNGEVIRDTEFSKYHIHQMTSVIDLDKLLNHRFASYVMGEDVYLTAEEFINNFYGK